jgi:hypothetical protein
VAARVSVIQQLCRFVGMDTSVLAALLSARHFLPKMVISAQLVNTAQD